jgi:hypothetical protein
LPRQKSARKYSAHITYLNLETCQIPPLRNGTSLQRDIARTLLYFDIFRHPLKLSEIYRFLPSNSVTVDEIQKACSSEPLNGCIVEINGLLCLDKGKTGYIDERSKKEQRARRMWRIAVIMSHIIQRFPFVRGIFVSGELSKGVASKKSDIDFFVITAPNRVWIARTIFTLFKRLFLFNQKKLFCYNHITSEQYLEITDRNIYTAMEVATLRPIYNMPLYIQFMNANSWIRDYLPNSYTFQSTPEGVGHKSPLSERIISCFLSSKNLEAIDLWLLSRWRSLWHHRYHSMSSEKRERLFRCEINVSTAYANDFLPRITCAYELRLDEYGLTAAGQARSDPPVDL